MKEIKRNFHNYSDYIRVRSSGEKIRIYFASYSSFTHSHISHKCLNMSFISVERFIVRNVAGGSFSFLSTHCWLFAMRKYLENELLIFFLFILSFFSPQDCHIRTHSSTGEPVVDQSQDYVLLQSNENATHTILRFRRKLNTCDEKFDVPITVSTLMIYNE